MVREIKLNVTTLSASHGIEFLFQTKEGGGVRLEAYFSQCTLRINFSPHPLGGTTFWTQVCIHKQSQLETQARRRGVWDATTAIH